MTVKTLRKIGRKQNTCIQPKMFVKKKIKTISKIMRQLNLYCALI